MKPLVGFQEVAQNLVKPMMNQLYMRHLINNVIFLQIFLWFFTIVFRRQINRLHQSSVFKVIVSHQ